MKFSIVNKNTNIDINYTELYKNLDKLNIENMLEISEANVSMYNRIRFKVAKYGKENNKKFSMKYRRKFNKTYKKNTLYVILKVDDNK